MCHRWNSKRSRRNVQFPSQLVLIPPRLTTAPLQPIPMKREHRRKRKILRHHQKLLVTRTPPLSHWPHLDGNLCRRRSRHFPLNVPWENLRGWTAPKLSRWTMDRYGLTPSALRTRLDCHRSRAPLLRRACWPLSGLRIVPKLRLRRRKDRRDRLPRISRCLREQRQTWMGTSRVHWKQKLLLKIQERQEAEAPFGIAWPLTRRELVSAELNFSVLGHIAPCGQGIRLASSA